MDEDLLRIFLEIRENFPEIKEKVSLLKPYFELHFSSPGMALKLKEFEGILGFEPELLYQGQEKVYGISVLYAIDDEVTRGIIVHEFAELTAREQGISDHETIDEISVKKGFARELLLALENVLPGRVERGFLDREDLEKRIARLREKLGQKYK